jgi:hypothetical protein
MYVRSKAKVLGRNILQNKLSTNKSGSFTGRWIDRQQAPSFDPKWKSINLAATVPGLTRLSAAQHDSAARLECLEDLSHKIAPPARAATGGVSDTASPVGYTPIMSASAAYRCAPVAPHAVLHSLPVVAEKHTDASASVSRRRARIHLQIDRSCSRNSTGPNGD